MTWIIYGLIEGRPLVENRYYFTKFYYTGAVKPSLNIKDARQFNTEEDASNCFDRENLRYKERWRIADIDIPPRVLPKLGEKAIGESIGNLGYLIGIYEGFRMEHQLSGVFDSEPETYWDVCNAESWDSQLIFRENFWQPDRWINGEIPLPDDLEISSGKVVVKKINN